MKPLPICAMIMALSLPLAGVTPSFAAAAPKVTVAQAVHDLAPTGKMRVAINYGNGVLAQRNATTGQLSGISVILATALGERLHVPVELVPYAAAGKVFEALEHSEWDLAFLAIEPERATKIEFSPPYVVIDGTYLVQADSPYHTVADVDRDGAKIAVGKGAAYDLFLSRTLHHATLTRADTSPAAIALFMSDKLDAAAGVRQALAAASKGDSKYRVLADRYSNIDQALAVPKGHPAGAAYVRVFLEDMKASGKIRAALEATGQDGNLVAPPAP